MPTKVTKVLVTGYDQVIRALGPLLVAGLERRKGVEAHWVHAAGDEQQAALNMVKEIDILVLSPASRQRDFDNEILAAASAAGRKIFILSDTWLAWRRVAKEHLPHIAGTNVCFKGEVEAAYSYGYRDVRPIIPPHWGAMYDGILKAVVVGPDVELPLADGSHRCRGEMKLVYFGGAKNPPLMNKILRSIATSMPGDGVLCFRPHPAEGADEATLAERSAFLRGVRMLDHKAAGLDSSNAMVANADVSIFVGGPTDSIGGAYALRPMIYFSDENVVEHNLRQDLPHGKWFVLERGGALGASAETLADQMRLLLEHPDLLRRSQDGAFPLPATWDTGPALAAAILGR